MVETLQEIETAIAAGKSRIEITYDIFDRIANMGATNDSCVQQVIGWYKVKAGKGQKIPDFILHHYKTLLDNVGYITEEAKSTKLMALKTKISGTVKSNEEIKPPVFYFCIENILLSTHATHTMDSIFDHFRENPTPNCDALYLSLKKQVPMAILHRIAKIYNQINSFDWEKLPIYDSAQLAFTSDALSKLAQDNFIFDLDPVVLDGLKNIIEFANKARTQRDVLLIMKFSHNRQIPRESKVFWQYQIAENIVSEGFIDNDQNSVINLCKSTGHAYVVIDPFEPQSPYAPIQRTEKLSMLKKIGYVAYAMVPIAATGVPPRIYFDGQMSIADIPSSILPASVTRQSLYAKLIEHGLLIDNKVSILINSQDIKNRLDTCFKSFQGYRLLASEDPVKYINYLNYLLERLYKKYISDPKSLIDDFCRWNIKPKNHKVAGVVHLLLTRENLKNIAFLEYQIKQIMELLSLGTALIQKKISSEDRDSILFKKVNELVELQEDYRRNLAHIETKIAEAEYQRGVAETANRAKSDFLMNMSHELRTPLNGVLTASELISLSETREELEEVRQIIQSSSQALLQTVETIIDFTKSKDGNLKLIEAPFKLNELFKKLKTRFFHKGAHISLKLDFDIKGDGVPNNFIGDESRLIEIFNHLLENSAKFNTNAPFVLISIKVNEASAEKTILHVTLTDNGIGIDRKYFDNIFEPFFQVDTSTTRQYDGAGIGLSACRQLVELMGGEIGVESELGTGSTFYFTVGLLKTDSKELLNLY